MIFIFLVNKQGLTSFSWIFIIYNIVNIFQECIYNIIIWKYMKLISAVCTAHLCGAAAIIHLVVRRYLLFPITYQEYDVLLCIQPIWKNVHRNF